MMRGEPESLEEEAMMVGGRSDKGPRFHAEKMGRRTRRGTADIFRLARAPHCLFDEANLLAIMPAQRKHGQGPPPTRSFCLLSVVLSCPFLQHTCALSTPLQAAVLKTSGLSTMRGQSFPPFRPPFQPPFRPSCAPVSIVSLSPFSLPLGRPMDRPHAVSAKTCSPRADSRLAMPFCRPLHISKRPREGRGTRRARENCISRCSYW